MKSNPEPSNENDESDEKDTLNNNSSKAAETVDGNEQENDFEIVGSTPSENTIHHYVEVQSDHQDDATWGYEIAAVHFLSRNVLFLVLCNLLFKAHLLLNIKKVLEKVETYLHLFETKCCTNFAVFKKPFFNCFS